MLFLEGVVDAYVEAGKLGGAGHELVAVHQEDPHQVVLCTERGGVV